MKIIIAPIKAGMDGDQVANLQDALNAVFEVNPLLLIGNSNAKDVRALFEAERKQRKFSKGTAVVVSAFRVFKQLPAGTDVDEKTAQELNEFLTSEGKLDDSPAPKPTPPPSHVPPESPSVPEENSRKVTGSALTADGAPAAGITLYLYSLLPNGKEDPQDSGPVDARGAYSLKIKATAPPKLQIQIRVGKDAEAIPLIRPKLVGNQIDPIHVVIPDKFKPAIDDEFTRLGKDLNAAGSSLEGLKAAEESDARRDLTLLKSLTGWDARILAIAAYTMRLAAGIPLNPQTIYALLRTGTAPNAIAIYQIGDTAFLERLKAAVDQNIVKITGGDLLTEAIRFKTAAAERRLNDSSSTVVSTSRQLLESASIPGADKAAFEKALAGKWETAQDLWSAAKKEKVTEKSIKKLQLQGQLAFLTADNAILTARLSGEIGEGDAATLADLSYHSPAKWNTLLKQLAAVPGTALDQLIPSNIAGADADARITNYANSLADRIRVAYPTRVMSAKIGSGELPLAAAEEDRSAISSLLVAADKKDFVIGRTPVGKFFRENADTFPEKTSAEQRQKLLDSVKRLHRLYQITPDDASLKVLAEENIRSAHHVASFSREEFVAYLTRKLDPNKVQELEIARAVAAQVHSKAQQVDATGRMIVTSVQQADRSPALPVLASERGVPPSTQAELIKRFPTLAGLFGNQSFCECAHCRSVLSPAAYFVDLLSYIDPKKETWEAFLSEWPAKHGGKPYPHLDKSNKPMTPFDALIERRPDLPQLALTCENTLTALPYVDLVNEIFENYIDAGLKPAAKTGDSAGLDSLDLIAEPQSSIPDVYVKLQREYFPLSLPFDLPTESMRAYCEQLETPFWRVLDAFRPHDELFKAEVQPRTYNTASILCERLGFASSEIKMLTGIGGAVHWFELYGFTKAGDAQQALPNARILADRLGVSYRDLTELVATQFVNPALGVMSALQRLGVTADAVYRYKKAPGYTEMTQVEEAAFKARLSDLGTETGEDVSAWLDASWTAKDFEKVLLLQAPATGCDPSEIKLVFPLAGKEVTGFEYSKLNVFVRLWRRLGWTIQELDAALIQILGTNTPSSIAGVGPAIRNALIGTAHLESLAGNLKVGRDARLKLLSLWGDLPVFGRGSLYSKIFLTKSAGTDVKVFDRVTGIPLPVDGPKVVTQLAAVQAATGASTPDISAILARAPKAPLTIVTADLSLANVSMVYRYALFANGLRISIGDLLDLKELCGLDPFAPPGVLDFNADNAPGASAVKFMQIVNLIRESGLSIADLRYLLLDESRGGELMPLAPAQISEMINRLQQALAPARAAYQVPADITSLSSEDLRQKLSVRYPEDVAATAVGLLDGTLHVSVIDTGLTAFSIDPAALSDYSELRLSFDAKFKKLQLDCAGVIPPTRLAEIKTKVAGIAPVHAALLSQMLDETRKKSQELFDKSIKDDLGTDPAVQFNALFADGSSAETRVAAVVPKLFPMCLEIAEARALPIELAAIMDADVARVVALTTDYSLLTDPNTIGTASKTDLVTALRKATSGTLDAAKTAAVAKCVTLLRKVLLVARRLALDEVDLRHFLLRKGDFKPSSLNDLPVAAVPAVPALPADLQRNLDRFSHIKLLAEFARLRRERELPAGMWVGLLAAARRVVPPAATVWQEIAQALDEYALHLAETLGSTPQLVLSAIKALSFDETSRVTVNPAPVGKEVVLNALAGIPGLARLIEVLIISNRFGVSAQTLQTWASPFTTPAIASELRAAIKGRYSDADWRAVVQPIADRLRRQRRSALVAHIMFKKEFELESELYESFLVDPAMEPVVKTSRVRLAIASTQLFINRCLMNMEKKVHPSALTAKWWVRMSHYRVWEASRKFLLFPNWLEPEFRDDQSHLFKALMGTLLEGNVDRDSVEDAFFRYLQGLDQIARLEMVAMYSDDEDESTFHVIGRTFSSPHKYFYRRMDRESWTPWEPVGCDIDGDQVVAATWRDRLCLFWLTVTEKKRAPKTASKFNDYAGTPVNHPTIKAVTDLEVRLNWCEYVNGEWLPRATGSNRTLVTFEGVVTEGENGKEKEYKPEQLFVHVRKQYSDGEEVGVEIHVLHDGVDPGMQAFLVRSRHAPAEVIRAEVPPELPYGERKSRDLAKQRFNTKKLVVGYDPSRGDDSDKFIEETILGSVRGDYWLLPTTDPNGPGESEPSQFDVPFFYEDHVNTFFVRPRAEAHTVSTWEYWGLEELAKKLLIDKRRFPFPVAPWFPNAIRPGGGALDSLIKLDLKTDWTTKPGTLVRFDDQVIGENLSLSKADLASRLRLDLTKERDLRLSDRLENRIRDGMLEGPGGLGGLDRIVGPGGAGFGGGGFGGGL